MNIPVLIDLSNLTKEDVTAPIENMGDRLLMAGQTLLLGMAAVFAVLAVLWIVIAIAGKLLARDDSESGAPAPQKVSAPAVAPIAAPTVAPTVVSDDEEIVAAITAAISVMLDKPQSAFRVVSFRQTSREAFRRNNSK